MTRGGTRACLAAAALWAGLGLAQETPPPRVPFPAQGNVQYAFSPDDQADQLIIEALRGARTQILVQAFSLTHRRIADALAAAQRRGVEVIVLADAEQTRAADARLAKDLAKSGVAVLLDSHHAAAHNKVIVIDAAAADCAVITGSYNFTYAAQHRNAENVLLLRANAGLCRAYARNWYRHRLHSLPYR